MYLPVKAPLTSSFCFENTYLSFNGIISREALIWTPNAAAPIRSDLNDRDDDPIPFLYTDFDTTETILGALMEPDVDDVGDEEATNLSGASNSVTLPIDERTAGIHPTATTQTRSRLRTLTREFLLKQTLVNAARRTSTASATTAIAMHYAGARKLSLNSSGDSIRMAVSFLHPIPTATPTTPTAPTTTTTTTTPTTPTTPTSLTPPTLDSPFQTPTHCINSYSPSIRRPPIFAHVAAMSADGPYGSELGQRSLEDDDEGLSREERMALAQRASMRMQATLAGMDWTRAEMGVSAWGLQRQGWGLRRDRRQAARIVSEEEQVMNTGRANRRVGASGMTSEGQQRMFEEVMEIDRTMREEFGGQENGRKVKGKSKGKKKRVSSERWGEKKGRNKGLLAERLDELDMDLEIGVVR